MAHHILPVRALLLILLLLSACAPREWPSGPATGTPALLPDAVVARDTARLPLKSWLPEGEPRVVALALHGLSDYSGLFLEEAAAQLTAGGVALYAYDQRGFGAAPGRGLWAGTETLVNDARATLALLRERHPGLPLVILGESMGGAIALLAGEGAADRVVLFAPALWSRDAMGPGLAGALWLVAHTVPRLTVPNSGPGFTPSDNTEALRRLGRDPLALRAIPIEVLWGVTNLMDTAVGSLPDCCGVPTLVLLGAKDDIVPQRPVRHALRAVPPAAPLTVGRYANGYHLLLRDSIRTVVLADLLAWVDNPSGALPSGADEVGQAWLAGRR